VDGSPHSLAALRRGAVLAAQRGAGLHVHDARQLVVCGDPAEVLIQRSADAQVLVIGGRLNSAEGNLLGGDVVPYCLSHAVCPVDVCADQRIPAAV
jgi:nucleotide-binding universal stress UspA family protein